ncbi:MAG: Cys-rich peptide radical SAM maturase CcpM [Caulobacteraceae bacterium]
MDGNAYVHFFQTRDNNYVYDVNTNSILKVSKEIYDYLKQNIDGCKEYFNEQMEQEIGKMLSAGFLSSKRMSEVEHPYSELLPYFIKNALSTITLQVTQQCNLRCNYCAYSGTYENRTHSDKIMSFEIAQKGIDFLIQNSSEAYKLNISFYGGEPLLMYELIKSCVSYAKKEAVGKDIRFSMTTNGTLLNDSIIEFLVENDFHLLISLDGPEEIHDKNRRFAANGQGTFKVIMNNIARFKNKYPDYVKKNIAFNAVLDGTTDFNCMNDFFCTYEDIKEFRTNINSIADKYLKKNVDVYKRYSIQQRYERFKYMLYKVNKLDMGFTSKLLNKEFTKFEDRLYKRKYSKSISEKEHHGGPCVPAVKKLFMDINGVFYPCERVSELSEPMKIGSVYEGLDVDKMRNILNIGKLTENTCKNCWAYRFCYLCAVQADNLTELSAEKKLSNCRNVRFKTEEDFKDYCMLMEFGCNFEEEELKYFNA